MSADIHPTIKAMDSDQVDVLAGMGRALVPDGEPSPFKHLNNEELASALLDLQEQGLITLGWDGEDEVFVQLNFNPEQARQEYQQRKAAKGPSRRERRRKNRKGAS